MLDSPVLTAHAIAVTLAVHAEHVNGVRVAAGARGRIAVHAAIAIAEQGHQTLDDPQNDQHDDQSCQSHIDRHLDRAVDVVVLRQVLLVVAHYQVSGLALEEQHEKESEAQCNPHACLG